MQVLCKHDGIRGVLARVELVIYVCEQHRPPAFEDDAPYAMAGSKRDAFVTLVGGAGAVDPMKRRTKERGKPQACEVEPKSIVQASHSVGIGAVASGKRAFVKVGEVHGASCLVGVGGSVGVRMGMGVMVLVGMGVLLAHNRRDQVAVEHAFCP